LTVIKISVNSKDVDSEHEMLSDRQWFIVSAK